jgi:hypothetical protein
MWLVSLLALSALALPAGATTLNFGNPGYTGNSDASGNPVYPYYGNIDGGSQINMLCDDFDHPVSPSDSFAVKISTVSNLTYSRFGSISAATKMYEQVFYLLSYMNTASTADIGNLQDAVWSYFSTSAPTTSASGATKTIAQWKTLAANNYTGKDYSMFRVATDASNQASGKQELVYTTGVTVAGLTSATPEPGTIAMLAGGLFLIGLRWYRTNADDKKRSSAPPAI